MSNVVTKQFDVSVCGSELFKEYTVSKNELLRDVDIDAHIFEVGESSITVTRFTSKQLFRQKVHDLIEKRL